MSLVIQLLGAVRVTCNATVLKLATDHARALLAYLAVEADISHPRATLATLLWPEENETTARHNLRQALFFLKQGLAVVPQRDTILQVTATTIRWNSQGVQVDFLSLQELWRLTQSHTHADIWTCAPCVERLVAALALYQGEFLQGHLLKESQPFEEWAIFLREQVHHQAVAMLDVLTDHYMAEGAYDQVQHYAARLVALEPWHEGGHRQLMQALAAQGRQSAALRQYESCRRTLQQELGVPPAAETTALYEQIRRGDLDKRTMRQGDKETRGEQAASSLLASSSPPHNLPIPLTPFIGRARSLAAIHSRLQQGVRLLTLVGPGGMGKTRLALEVGRQQLATYPDGIVFVSLSALTTPAALAGAIVTTLAATLGVALQGSDPQAVLCHYLQARRLLLILDNFEHLLAGSTVGVDLVSMLLQSAPGVQILVTSRERLQLRGEQLFQVQALSVAKTATLAEAAAIPSVQLFVQSAQFVQADFQLTATNLAAVLRICQLVQGMPLGLELAAAQVGVMSLQAVAEAIVQSIEVLAVDWHDLPPRQRSLRAVFAWSWRLLTAEEQRVLRQLSIFQGGFDLAAAQAVTAATLPLLNRLCHKSLLQWQETASGEGRYDLHELLRQFAAEELHSAGEDSLAATNHGRYYLAYLAARGLRLGRQEPKEAGAEIQAELDNIRLAWQWAAAGGRFFELEQATYAWWQFFLLQGPDAEARLGFATAIAGVRRRLAATVDDASTRLLGQRLLAKLLAIHAYYLNSDTPHVAMAAQAREAMQLGAASGGFEGECWGAILLGRALVSFNQHQEAIALWQQTLQLVRRYQPDHPENEWLHEANWEAHERIAAMLCQLDDYAGSRAAARQSLQICQALGKRRGELSCLRNLAQLNLFLYDLAAAEKGFVAALALARALNYRRLEMMAQDGLGHVLRLRGDYATARSTWEQAGGTAAELASFYDEAIIWAALIRLHCQLGDYAAAAQRNERLTHLLAHHNILQEGELYRCLVAASLAQGAGDQRLALHYAEQANQLTAGGEMLFRRIETALSLGHACAAVEQWAAAAAAFQQALGDLQQFGNQALAAEPQAGLAQIALAQGNRVGALAQVEVILPVLAEQPHAGYNSPFFIYWICYQVLAANGDPRATTVLARGYDLLQQCAAPLDATTRHCFLTAVPVNRELIAAYLAWRPPVWIGMNAKVDKASNQR